MALKGSSGSSSLPPSTRRSSPSPSSVISRRSSLSASTWTASGAPSPLNPSAISGNGLDSISHSFLPSKVEQVAEEADSLKESLDKYFLRNQRRTQEARERAELLGRANGESSHVLRIFDEEAQAMHSARNSSRMLEESYATGVAIIAQYAGQKERLKRAQRKALDVLNTVGLSNSVLRLIERRHHVDKWIKYIGMVLTMIILISFWRWTR